MSSRLLEFLKHKIYLSGCCRDDSCFRKITVTCSFYLFIYLAVPGLVGSMQGLQSSLQHLDL